MNKSFALLAACLALAGCGDGFSPSKVRGAVAADHPGSEVQNLPRSSYTFLVREPSGRVLYVEYMGSDLTATTVVPMFYERAP